MEDKEYNLTESIEYLIVKLLTAEGYTVSKIKLDTIGEENVLNYKGKLQIKAKKQ